MGPEEFPLLVDETRLIRIPVRIGCTVQEAAVDSGSTLNIISDSCASRHNLPVEPCLRDIYIRMADGSRAKPGGEASITLTIGGESFVVDFLVLKTFPYDFLLGLNFMRSAPLDIVFSEGIVRVGQKRTVIEIPKSKDTNISLLLFKHLVLPPQTKKCVEVTGGMNGARHFLVEKAGTAPLTVPPVLSRARHVCHKRKKQPSKIWIAVENNTCRTIRLKRSQPIATATPVRDEECLSLALDSHAPSAPATPAPTIRSSLLNLGSHLTPDQRKQFSAMLSDESDKVFARHEFDLGRTTLLKHHIDTGDAPPIRSAPYRKSFTERQVVQDLVSNLKKAGVVRDSCSPWAAPVVLVKKKGGGHRLCCDWRKLNAITKKDAMPLPRIDDTLDRMAGCSFFTTMDLPSGYFQVDLEEDSIEKTAFVTPDGNYEFTAMGQGLCNAPATFQRLMHRVLGDLIFKCCQPYLDDIVIFSKSFEDHKRHVAQVLAALRAAGLKIRPDKCSFAQKEIKFLGHVVSADGVLPDPDKLRGVADFPAPRNVKEVQRFHGLCSYFRRFVPDFAVTAKPLTSLFNKGTPWTWGDDEELAFQALKYCLLAPPILAHPDFSRPFLVSTDASNYGVGAVLKQRRVDGEEQVIAYASRNLNQAETNYSATERECLAVIFAIVKFRPYLYGAKFSVITDHCALCWLMKVKNPNGRLVRWSLSLQDYDFEIIYKSGKKHLDADALSRCPVDPAPETSGDNHLLALDKEDGTSVSVRDLQEGEGWLRPILNVLKDPTTAATRTTRRRARSYAIRGGLVYRKVVEKEGQVKMAIVVPAPLRQQVLAAMHDHVTSGHLGVTKTWLKMRPRFHWPQMFKDVKKHVLSCLKCGAKNVCHQAPAGLLQPLAPTVTPFERVGLDSLGPFQQSIDGNVHILVLTDYTTRMAFAKAVPRATAEETAKFMVAEILTRHGTPRQVLTDRGTEYVNKTFDCIATTYGFTHLKTTAYRPQTNGLTERFNGTLAKMISAYTTDHKDWDRFLPHLVFAYNTSVHATTGYTPYFLLHGLEPTLGIEAQLNQGLAPAENFNFENIMYASRAREMAAAETTRSQQKAKERYDEKRREVVYQPGDQVWIRRMARPPGKTEKLLPAYLGPFRIIARTAPNDYEVEDAAGKHDIINVERMKKFYPRQEDPAPAPVTGATHPQPPPVVPTAGPAGNGAEVAFPPPPPLPDYLMFDNEPTEEELDEMAGENGADLAGYDSDATEIIGDDEEEEWFDAQSTHEEEEPTGYQTRSGRWSRPPGWLSRCAPSTL